jgi:predicted metal-dependent phosphoesterase TrpH
MNTIADLHLHTTYSDGMLTPFELVASGKKAGLQVMAITDHDTVDGIEQALLAGQQMGITVVPGIELSASLDEKEVHILGYYLDNRSKELLQILEWFKKERLNRAKQMVEKLNALRLPVTLNRVLELAGDGVVARPHVARAMVEQGCVSSYAQAFTDFIGNGRPAYVKKNNYPAEKAIELIHKAGGLSVIAHPGHTITEEELLQLIQYGIDGIEVVHPSHTPEEMNFYRGIANEYYLLETGGSDYHGGMKENEPSLGKITISASVVDALRYRLLPPK